MMPMTKMESIECDWNKVENMAEVETSVAPTFLLLLLTTLFDCWNLGVVVVVRRQQRKVCIVHVPLGVNEEKSFGWRSCW